MVAMEVIMAGDGFARQAESRLLHDLWRDLSNLDIRNDQFCILRFADGNRTTGGAEDEGKNQETEVSKWSG